MSYSSASAKQAGVDLDHLAAYITVISHVAPTMAPESIGRAIKTMSARMTDIKANKITEDDIGLNAVESSLRNVNIQLRDTPTSFRPMQDILSDLGKKWGTLNQLQQDDIIKNFAGKQQREQFLIIMQNQVLLQKALTTEANSAGTAEERYAIKLESVLAAQNRLSDAVDQTWQKTMNSDGLIFLDNTLASILDLVSASGGWLEIIKQLGMVFAPALRVVDAFMTALDNPIFWKFIEGIRDLKNYLESDTFKTARDIFNFGWDDVFKAITPSIVDQKKAIDDLTESKKKLNAAQEEGNRLYTPTSGLSDKPYGPEKPAVIRPVFDLSGRLEELNSMVKDTGDLMAKAATEELKFSDIQELIAKNPDFIDMVSIDQATGKIKIATEELRKLDLEKARSGLATAQEALQADILNKASQQTIDRDKETVEVMQKYVNSIIDGSAYAEQLAKAQEKLSKAREKAARDALEAEKKEAQIHLKYLNDQKKAADDLLKLTIAMIRQEKQEEKEHLQDQIDNYNDLIDARIAALDALKNEEDYKRGLKKDVKKSTDIKNQIAILQLDNSPEAKAKILRLQQELAEQTEKIQDKQRDHKLELEKAALKAEKEQFDNAMKDKIQIIEDYLKQTGTITQDALDLIQNHGEELYKKLIDWNRVYGDGVDATIVEAWNKGRDAVINYQQLLIDITTQQVLIEHLNAIDLDVTQPWKTATDAVQGYIDKLKEIPATTGTAAGNVDNGKPTGTVGGAIDVTAGATVGNGNIVPTLPFPNPFTPTLHHSGLDSGPVGGLKTSSNEQLAKLLKGEIVINGPQQENFLKNVLPNIAKTTSNMTNMGGNNLTIEHLMTFNGPVDKNVIPDIKKIADQVVQQINNGNFMRGIKRNTNLNSV